MTVHEGPIIIRNRYLPKQGKFDQFYALRQRASEVRQQIGAKGGQVFREQNKQGKKYVVWQCEYRSIDARKKDISVVKASPEFNDIKGKMKSMTANFDRSTIEKIR